MTVSEVAQYLSLDPQTVSRKAQGGELPAFKVGNRWRFDKEDIDRWIGSQKKGTNDLQLRLERTWEKIRASAEKRGLERSSIPGLLIEIRSARSTA
jgi:excisionase family DNA binding protein